MVDSKQYRTSKFQKQKRRRKIIYSIIWMGLFVSLFGLIVYFSQHESFKIHEIQIVNNHLVSQAELIEIAENNMFGNYYYLFSKRNSLLLPRKKIENEIINFSLTISDVDLKLVNRNTLSIKITEHYPVAKWCPNLSDLQGGVLFNPECYLINENGLIYTNDDPFLDYDREDIMLVFGLLESKSDNLIGEHYLDKTVFKNLLLITQNIESLQIFTSYINSEDHETFYIKTTTGPKLLISKFNKPDKVFANLKTVIEIEEINRAQFRNLEYIDLRFDNRVYYKIR